jgi:hypothetical protein
MLEVDIPLPLYGKCNPGAPQSIWHAFWGVPMVAPIGIGTGTTHILQVLVAYLAPLSPGWAESKTPLRSSDTEHCIAQHRSRRTRNSLPPCKKTARFSPSEDGKSQTSDLRRTIYC